MKEEIWLEGRHAEKLLKVLVCTLIISVMNVAMFNVVLPQISQEFDLAPSQVSWIMTSYMILYAVGTVTYGKLADTIKLKNLVTFGLVLFALGSLTGLTAATYGMVILGRVLQAAGAAVVPAIAMQIPVRYFPPERRGLALGTTATGLALGAALAPIMAGVISSAGNWRMLFALSLLSLITLPFYRKYLPEDVPGGGKPSVWGGALLAGTVAFFLLTITTGSWLALLAGGVLLLLLVLHIRYATDPFIQPSLFRNKPFVMAMVLSFLVVGVMMGIPFLLPQLLADVHHLTPAMIGLLMFPGALAAAIMGRQGGKLADAKGNPYLVYLAAILLFACFAPLAVIAGFTPYWMILFLILGNVGQTFMQVGLSNTISRTLPRDQIGVGMGLFSMSNFISGAAGAAVIGKVLDGGSALRLIPLGSPESGVYSNMFVAMTLLIVLVSVLYARQFGSTRPELKPGNPERQVG